VLGGACRTIAVAELSRCEPNVSWKSGVALMNLRRIDTRNAAALPLMLALYLTLAGCSGLQIGTQIDDSETLRKYHRFAWMPTQAGAAKDPLVAQYGCDAIEAELKHRGFQAAADPTQADLIVDFSLGSDKRSSTRSSADPYIGPWVPEVPDWTAYQMLRNQQQWQTGINAQEYEGTLAIMMFDARTHRSVWRGWARKALTDADAANPGDLIRKAVRKIFQEFPKT